MVLEVVVKDWFARVAMSDVQRGACWTGGPCFALPRYISPPPQTPSPPLMGASNRVYRVTSWWPEHRSVPLRPHA